MEKKVQIKQSDAIVSPQGSSPLKLLRRRQVEAKTGLGKSQIYLLQNKREFPTSIQLSSGTGTRSGVAWLEHELDTWIQSRVDASRKRVGGVE